MATLIPPPLAYVGQRFFFFFFAPHAEESSEGSFSAVSNIPGFSLACKVDALFNIFDEVSASDSRKKLCWNTRNNEYWQQRLSA